MNRLWMCTIILVVSAFATTGEAGGSTCAGPEYHQFDFFVGNWIVSHKGGKRFATDRVTKEFGGCAIWERWYGDRGSRGAGYSSYLPSRHLWVQSFVDDDGDVLVFEGTRTSKSSLTFRGPSYPKQGLVEQNRVIFRLLPKNVMEEYWVVSDDRGRTWKVAFDGFFDRTT